MSGLLPNYIMRQFTPDGKLASGATMGFYQSGTLTPKTVYADATLTTPLTNPVVLSASASKNIFLGDGAYRIWVKDQYGAQIEPWIDGIIASGTGSSSLDSNITYAMFKTYSDLRSCNTIPDLVYVSGRLVEGDGGQGWFQYVSGSALLDDGGIVLASHSNTVKYIRVYDAFIDPRWYGLRYGVSIDNKIYLQAALSASNLYNQPVQIAGSTYITSNMTFPSYSSIQFTEDGYLVAPTAITVTFGDYARCASEGRAFGNNVNVVFGTSSTEEVYLSWLGGAVGDDRLTKLINSSSTIMLVVDESITVASGAWTCNSPIRFNDKAVIDFTLGASLDLQFTKLVPQAQPIKMFNIINTIPITAIEFGSVVACPEWFGADGVGVTDQTVAIASCIKSGKMYLSEGKTYYAPNTLPTKVNCSISGGGKLRLGATLNINNLRISDSIVELSSIFNWLNASKLYAYNATIPSTFAVTELDVSACNMSDQPYGPAGYNTRLPLLTGASTLGVDGDGRIVGGTVGIDQGLVKTSTYGPSGITAGESKIWFQNTAANQLLWLGYSSTYPNTTCVTIIPAIDVTFKIKPPAGETIMGSTGDLVVPGLTGTSYNICITLFKVGTDWKAGR